MSYLIAIVSILLSGLAEADYEADAKWLLNHGLSAPWAEFSKTPVLRRIADKIEVGTILSDLPNSDDVKYWMRRTISDPQRRVTVTWADSRNCPAVRSVVAEMREIPIPKPAPPGFMEPMDIVMDGVNYVVQVPVQYGKAIGKLKLNTNIGTPLATWVDASFSSLEKCWMPKVPEKIIR